MGEDSSTVTEDTPLLDDDNGTSQNHSIPPLPARNARRISIILAVVFFILSASSVVMVIPLTRLMENSICHRYYEGEIPAREPIDESLCKVDEIQSELAFVNGILSTLEAVPTFLFAIPYGHLADRIGRKPVFALAQLGLLLSAAWIMIVIWFQEIFPLRLIWLSPFAAIIGGGSTISLSTIYSIVADVASPAERASTFLRFSVASNFGNLVAPLIASKFMKEGFLWTPLLIAPIASVLGSCLVLFIPETLQQKISPNEIAHPETAKFTSKLKQYARSTSSHLLESLSLLKSISLLLVLSTFLVHVLSVEVSSQFVVQYISKRFGWSLDQTGYLLSMRAVVNIVVLFFVFPAISNLLVSPRFPFRLSASHKDLLLARMALSLLSIGTLLLATPKFGTFILGLVIYTFGTGYSPHCRSLITTFVDAQHISRLYSLVSITDTIGALAGGPFLAGLFSVGMKWKGAWLGLPYLGAGTASACAATALFFVRLPKKDPDTLMGDEARVLLRPEDEGLEVGPLEI